MISANFLKVQKAVCLGLIEGIGSYKVHGRAPGLFSYSIIQENVKFQPNIFHIDDCFFEIWVIE